jgi:bla regulator protein BlaR1
MAEILTLLYTAALVSTLAILGVLLLRGPLRHWFGATPAYLAWFAVPVALLAALAPDPGRALATLPLPGVVYDRATDEILLATAATSHLARAICGLWAAGVVLSALILCLRQRRFVRSLGRLVPAQGVAYAAPAGVSPVVVGWLRPLIVLPHDFESRYTEEERTLILAHERMHVRRGDLFANAAWTLMRCLLWFNPLAHVATSRFRFDQELACDASTLRGAGRSPKVYATAMLKTLIADASAPLSSAWQASHPLKQRLLGLRRPRPTLVRRCAGLASIAALMCAAAWGAGALQPVTAYREATGPKAAGTMCPLEARRRRWLLVDNAAPSRPTP